MAPISEVSPHDPTATDAMPIGVSSVKDQGAESVLTESSSSLGFFPFGSLSDGSVPALVDHGSACASLSPSYQQGFGDVRCSHPLSAQTYTHSPEARPSQGREEDREEGLPQEDMLSSLSRLAAPRQVPSSLGPLHPGALWVGTQKSGRTSYDVCVRIVDVDIEGGTASGYLRICGLTPDLPELTTFFDAEIIGLRHGFLTGKWGATETDDMTHWSRFPSFRPLRNSLAKPMMTFNHHDRPFVFLRWKEQFVVPDHKMTSLPGASFAGFYYICIDFSSPAGGNVQAPSARRPSISHRPTSASRSPTRVRDPASAAVRPSPSRDRSDSTNGRPLATGPAPPGPPRTFSYAAAVRGRTSSESGTGPHTGIVPSSSPEVSSESASDSSTTLTDGPQTSPLSHASSTGDQKAEDSSEAATAPGPQVISASPTSPTTATRPLLESLEEFPAPSSPPMRTEPLFGRSPLPRRRPSASSGLTLTRPRDGSTSPVLGRRPSVHAIYDSPAATPTSADLHPHGNALWSHASMTGFYHHSSSEPYQELVLKYAPHAFECDAWERLGTNMSGVRGRSSDMTPWKRDMDERAMNAPELFEGGRSEWKCRGSASFELR